MGLCEEDRIVINNPYEFKSYGTKRRVKEFLTKRWKKTTLNDFLKHLKEQCANAWKCDSGRPRTSRTAGNNSDVNDLFLSQEGAP